MPSTEQSAQLFLCTLDKIIVFDGCAGGVNHSYSDLPDVGGATDQISVGSLK